MNGRYTRTAACLILVITAFSLLAHVPENVEAQEQQEATLYLWRTNRYLDTDQPSASEGLETIISGSNVTHTLHYPITVDTSISGPIEGGRPVMLLHLQELTPTGNPQELTVNVFMDPGRGSSVKIAGSSFDADALSSDDLEVPFISSSGADLPAGSVIRLEMEYSAQGAAPQMTFFYGGTGNSYLNFYTDVIPEDRMEVKVLDSSGDQVNEVVPYGPADDRELTFVCSMTDIFGAYDISEVNLLISSPGGGILLNQTTDAPEPGGGARITYFNHTYTLPEGTPTGTYIMTATATSNTGQQTAVTDTFDVSSGLLVTLREDSIEIDAGDTATFTMEVLNGGDSVDRVSFTGNCDKEGWNVNTPETVELDGGDNVEVEFRVETPIRASESETASVTLTAESRNLDRSYSKEGEIVIVGSASFGFQLVGEPLVPLFSGTSHEYTTLLTNLEAENRTFTLSTEGLPGGWDVTFAAETGGYSGSLYEVEVNSSGEQDVKITAAVPQGEESGSYQFSVYARPGSGDIDERRYIYMTVKVVDGSRDVVTLTSGTDTKRAARKGTDVPVRYSAAFFTLEIYNPTLEEVDVDLSVSVPSGWDADHDFDEVDLAAGQGSLWNLSITPADGELYNGGNPYEADVTVDAGSAGQYSRTLKVTLPLVSEVSAETDADLISVEVGASRTVNITLTNKGNRPETVIITADTPEGVEADIVPSSVDLSTGSEGRSAITFDVSSMPEADLITVRITCSYGGGSEEVSVSLEVEEKTESEGFDIMLAVYVGIGVVVILGAAFLGYTLWKKRTTGSKPQKKPAKRSEKKDKPGVTVSSEDRAQKGKGKKAPPESDVVNKADQALMSLLGEEEQGKKEGDAGGEKVEAVEAEVLE